MKNITAHNPSHQLLFVCHIMLLLFMITGCATERKQPPAPPQQAKSALKNTPGILVMHGEPFITAYDDTKFSSFLFEVSMSFSDRLYNALERRGIPAQLHTVRDRRGDVRGDMKKLLSEKRREGLIQVSVYTTGSDQRRQIAIRPNYNPLKLLPSGELLVENGVSAEYIVFDSQDYRKAHESMAALANKFAEQIASSYFRR